jgi:hypothetical protein
VVLLRLISDPRAYFVGLSMSRVILIEYNELCPPLLDRWMAAGDLPNFKKFYDSSDVFITEADDSGEMILEPWIQWYSIHTGVPYRDHHVFHLTDGARADHADVWRILHASGKQVWNCGSMNCRGFSFPGSAFLPDPWSTTEQAYPPEIEKARRFISHNVQQYTNSEAAQKWRTAAEFVTFMASHGLRPTTTSAILQQIASEYYKKGATRWRRAALLDKMQFDLFKYYYRHLRPDFSSFFVNSTAHLQHAYWRHMEPELFAVRPTAEEVALYKNAIFYGYQEMDWLLGQFLTLSEAGTRLILATGFSQQPWPHDDEFFGEGVCYYKPRDPHVLLSNVGIYPNKLLPLMTPRYIAHFDDATAVEAAKEKLATITFKGQQLIGVTSSEPETLVFGNKIRYQVPNGSRVEVKDTARSVDFYDWFYKVEEMRSTEHHPDGYLWVRNGKHRRHQDKVSILDILPTVLGMYGLQESGLQGNDLMAPFK